MKNRRSFNASIKYFNGLKILDEEQSEKFIHCDLSDNVYLKMKAINRKSFEETRHEPILHDNILSLFFIKFSINFYIEINFLKHFVNLRKD